MPEQEPKGAVLIVGDWFVDEHWVAGVHRSSSASRTGNRHSRALNAPNSEVRAFCGAGRSAYFLYHVRDNDKERLFPNLVGLGFWHHNDTDVLKALFDPTACLHSPYRLVDEKCSDHSAEGVELVNMHDSLLRNQKMEYRSEVEFTDRMIRIYRKGADEKISYERFDWEPPLKKVQWKEGQLEHLSGQVKEALSEKEVSVVIIKDLLRDAITPEIIDWLANGLGRNACWYISSKRWRPDWIEYLQNVQVRLFLVPQVAANEALNEEGDLGCWLTPSGQPSQEGLEHIEALRESLTRKTDKGEMRKDDTLLVVSPTEYSVLCQIPSETGYDCIVQAYDPPATPVPMGSASIFFPALCACLEYGGKDMDFQKVLCHALTCTYDWTTLEGMRVLNPASWKPIPDVPRPGESWDPQPSLLDISKSGGRAQHFRETTSARSWTDEKQWWIQSLRDELGIVSVGGRKQLQMRRAMVEIPGYVCCETSKRDSLRRLVRQIGNIGSESGSHSACMLVARPGTGKTFLVRRLASLANLVFVPFNITQMSTRSDILGCFDTIVAEQAQRPNERLLVFIDEINAELDGSSVYGSFLAPLEEGVYIRGGKTFHIKSCLWVFAGTDNPADPEAHGPRTAKGSDFVSRLNLGVVNLDPGKMKGNSNDQESLMNHQLALEKVYVGAAHLLREFPDVLWVSSDVLRAFRELPASSRVRDIKHFVRQFRNIQYGKVTADNVPQEWPDSKCRKRWEKARKPRDCEEFNADIQIVDS